MQFTASKTFKRLGSSTLLAAALLGSGGAHAQAGDGYWQGVQKAGVLRCGAAIYAPYVMRNPSTGEYTGFFSDLCRQFAAVLKVKPQFIDASWDNIVAGIQSGKWDMALALNRTPTRAMALQYSIPASNFEIALVYNKANKKIPASARSTADLDKPGMVFVVVSGTSNDKSISEAVTKAQVLRLPSIDDARLALQSKRADILVDTSDAARLFIQSNPTWATALSPTPALSKLGISFGLPRQMSYADVEVVNTFLEEKVATGEVDKLIQKAGEELLKNGGK